jgi:hypothetical protein
MDKYSAVAITSHEIVDFNCHEHQNPCLSTLRQAMNSQHWSQTIKNQDQNPKLWTLSQEPTNPTLSSLPNNSFTTEICTVLVKQHPHPTSLQSRNQNVIPFLNAVEQYVYGMPDTTLDLERSKQNEESETVQHGSSGCRRIGLWRQI